MADLPRKAAARTARLAALPLGYAGRSAIGLGKRLGGAPAEAVMTDIQQTHGRAALPHPGRAQGRGDEVRPGAVGARGGAARGVAAPYRDQLTRLQDSAPPMPTQTVRDTLDQRPRPRTGRTSWSGSTAARPPRASIGQVHKGRWHDGREVAVKVQYPGAGDALRSDLRQLARLARTIGPLLPGIDVKPLVEEVAGPRRGRARLQARGRGPAAFAEAFGDDPDIVVPDVVAVGDTVLITEWLESPASLACVIADGTQEERDHYGELCVRFLFAGPGRTGMLHADPHPGNFRILPERGRLPRPARRARLRRRGAAARSATCPRRWAA